MQSPEGCLQGHVKAADESWIYKASHQPPATCYCHQQSTRDATDADYDNHFHIFVHYCLNISSLGNLQLQMLLCLLKALTT